SLRPAAILGAGGVMRYTAIWPFSSFGTWKFRKSRRSLKTALTLTFITCGARLYAQPGPAAPAPVIRGGPITQSTSGPIGRSALREATRVALVAEPTASPEKDTQPRSSQSKWSRVQNVKAASKVLVTPKGLPSRERYFVEANPSELVVLNLTDQ